MSEAKGWLKELLQDSVKAVDAWPEWKKALESATTEAQVYGVVNQDEGEAPKTPKM